MTLTKQSHDTSIQSAAETLRELIHSFGFYPANSLMILWLRSDEVVLTQRSDVDAFLEPEDLSCSDLELFVEPGRTYLADQAIIVVCLDSMDARIHSGIEAVDGMLAEHEIDLAQAFVVVGQRIYSRECSEDCDPHFTLVDMHIDRSARAAECESNPTEFIDVKEFPQLPIPGKLTHWRVAESQFVQQLLSQECDPVTIPELARLVVALADIRIRDSILWDMANGVFDMNLVAELLTGLLPKLDVDRGAPVATTVAICWWLQGNGAMANMCIARACVDAPNYSLATLIRAALDYALPPDFWLESVNVLTRKECLAGLALAR